MAPELKRRITNTLTQESQIYYYKISSDEQKVMEKSWDGLALLGFSTIKFGPQHVVCPSFPDMVSDNTWNYC
jgi:hypothetical protein